MMMQMVGAFADYAKHAMLRERTRASLEAARRDGCIGKRRLKLNPQQQAGIIRTLSRSHKTEAEAARETVMGDILSTFFRRSASRPPSECDKGSADGVCISAAT